MKPIKANAVSPVPTKDLPPALAKSPKLTPWFDGAVRPHRIGVYETRPMPNDGAHYQNWNGSWWGGWGGDIQIAIQNAGFASCAQNAKWRGLASNPARSSK